MGMALKKFKKRGRSSLNKADGVKRAKKEVNPKVDYISNLPGPVLHHIVSFLHPKDAARTCILSKRWKRVWSSHQVVNVDLHHCRKMDRASKRNYKNLIDQSLMNNKEQLLTIHKFRLRIGSPCEFLTDVHRWINAAVERNVKELEILSNSFKHFVYLLPPCVLNGSSITALNLSSCRFPVSVDIHLPGLQKLSLKKISLPPGMLQKFISSCPLIDDLRLIRCTRLKQLTISTLDKLKRVDIHQCHDLQSIVIEAPTLQVFWYFNSRRRLCKINLKACRALKKLVLEYPRMTDTLFHEQLLDFPTLEELVLSRCRGLKSLQLFGNHFRDLVIRSCPKLNLVQVDTPNLTSLEYSGQRMPFSFRTPPQSLKEALLSFESSSTFNGDDADRLNCFFDYINPCKGLKLMTHGENKSDMVIYEDMRAMLLPLGHISRPYVVKISTNLVKLLDRALNTPPYPSSISLVSQRSSAFPEIIYAELNKAKAEPQCCVYFSNKCWRHYLNSFSVENWILESSDGSEVSTSLQWKKSTLALAWKADKQTQEVAKSDSDE